MFAAILLAAAVSLALISPWLALPCTLAAAVVLVRGGNDAE